MTLAKVYDPRDNTEKYSANPALLALQTMLYVVDANNYELLPDFYRDIIYYANYCEEEVKQNI